MELLGTTEDVPIDGLIVPMGSRTLLISEADVVRSVSSTIRHWLDEALRHRGTGPNPSGNADEEPGEYR